jgi:hypothetical protein
MTQFSVRWPSHDDWRRLAETKDLLALYGLTLEHRLEGHSAESMPAGGPQL